MPDIKIFGEVTPQMALVVKQQLEAAAGAPVLVRVDSGGGDVFAGFSIYDSLANYEGKVNTIVESSAFSIASLIAMAGESIEMTENAYFMLHNPYTEVQGDYEELANKSEVLKKIQATMLDVYAAHTGQSLDEVTQILRKESYFNASESVAMGLATAVQQRVAPSRVVAETKDVSSIPFPIVARLRANDANHNPISEEPIMAEKNPATIRQIRSAFPKASNDFVVRCMEKEMPIEEVGEEMVDQLMSENEELLAKLSAMTEEMEAMKAGEDEKVEAAVAAAKEESEQEIAALRAKVGIRPVASRSGGGVTGSARERWNEAIEQYTAKGLPRIEATKRANRSNPGLREEMLAEAQTTV